MSYFFEFIFALGKIDLVLQGSVNAANYIYIIYSIINRIKYCLK